MRKFLSLALIAALGLSVVACTTQPVEEVENNETEVNEEVENNETEENEEVENEETEAETENTEVVAE